MGICPILYQLVGLRPIVYLLISICLIVYLWMGRFPFLYLLIAFFPILFLFLSASTPWSCREFYISSDAVCIPSMYAKMVRRRRFIGNNYLSLSHIILIIRKILNFRLQDLYLKSILNFLRHWIVFSNVL